MPIQIHASLCKASIAGLALSAGLVGCETAQLKPASEAQQVSGMDNAARTHVEGVQVTVQDTEWPGEVPISEEVTPLRVSIENESGKPLRIVYSEFALVDADEGLISTALPLYEIDASVERPVRVNTYPTITQPGFVYSDFAIAPYLNDIYPGVGVTGVPFYYDQYYYDNHITYWETAELPTPEMLTNALPEGTLNDGGRVDGWLYFRNFEDADRVVFRADLVNARAGTEFGEVRVPFAVR